jgi:hypothetical protein
MFGIILAVLAGAAAFYVTFLIAHRWAKTGESVSDTTIGFCFGVAMLSVYVASSVVYWMN